MLSVKVWRINRPRDAPIARRTAISRYLEDDRASSRLAIFTHAISKTKLTEPSNTISITFAFPTTSFCSGTSRIVQRAFSG